MTKTVFAVTLALGLAACPDGHMVDDNGLTISSELEEACREFNEIYVECLLEMSDDPMIAAAAPYAGDECGQWRGTTGAAADDTTEWYYCLTDALSGADCSSEDLFYDTTMDTMTACYQGT